METKVGLTGAHFSGISGDSSPVPQGYKRTAVGVVPNDWEIRSLQSCLNSTPDYGINAAAVAFDDNLPTYLRITDIDQNSQFRPSPRVSVKHLSAHRYFLNDGELVFARTGASVGKSYFYSRSDGQLVFAGYLIRIIPNPEKLHPSFLAYSVQSRRYWNWVAAASLRSGQPGINSHEYGTFLLALPQLDEQHSIAEALSDIDALIRSLEAVISKKQAIKQATLQQLLTGKTRLPGFAGEWVSKKLGQIGVFSKGRGVRLEDVSDEGLPCVLYGELYTRYENYILEVGSRISPSVADTALPLETGDLLFAGSGETADDIGRCAAYLGSERAYAGGDIVVLTPSGVDSMFLGHLMNHPSVSAQKSRLGQGNAVVHISVSNLAQIEITLPPLPEQITIAAVLSDMDAELTALERRLEKTRSIKQGTMQDLLTGRARLVTAGD